MALTAADLLLPRLNRATRRFVSIDAARLAFPDHAIDARLGRLFTQPRYEQGTGEWLAARWHGVSASEALAPLGKHVYKSRAQWFEEKALPYIPDAPDPLAGNPHVRRGKFYEDVAAAVYEREHGRLVFDFGVLRKDSVDWVIGSPDGVTACGRLLEIKCPASVQPGYVRPYYAAQCQLNMEICDVDVCDYVQYDAVRGTIDVTELHRDRAWFAGWLREVEPLWMMVLAFRAGDITMADVPPEFHRRSRKRPSRDVSAPVEHFTDDDEGSDYEGEDQLTECDFVD